MTIFFNSGVSIIDKKIIIKSAKKVNIKCFEKKNNNSYLTSHQLERCRRK